MRVSKLKDDHQHRIDRAMLIIKEALIENVFYKDFPPGDGVALTTAAHPEGPEPQNLELNEDALETVILESVNWNWHVLRKKEEENGPW